MYIFSLKVNKLEASCNNQSKELIRPVTPIIITIKDSKITYISGEQRFLKKQSDSKSVSTNQKSKITNENKLNRLVNKFSFHL